MSVKKNKNEELRDVLFLRYNSGGLLFIATDIKQKTAQLIDALEKEIDYNKVFNDLIKNISDQSGASIHVESTWYQAARELFRRYERYSSEPIHDESKQALIGLLKLLVQGDEKTTFDWDIVRRYIIDNLDALCPVETSRFLSFDGHEVMRAEDGTYFYEENGQTVTVQGLKTPVEEKMAFYTNDAQMQFGRLYSVIKFIALFDIAYEYDNHREDFPVKLSCVLYDNSGTDTSYLLWNWNFPTPFEYVPFKWTPRSQFSNPDWLSADLIMRLPFVSEPPSKTIVPIMPSETAASQWEEAFNGYKRQLEIPVVSNVLIGEEPEVYFDFMDRKVRWVNGNAFTQPIVVVPCNEEDGSDGIEIARKFMSLVNMQHEVELSEHLISVHQLRYLPFFKSLRMPTFLMVDPTYVLPQDDTSQYSKKKWYALAFLREAVNSRSIYYAFLCYFKIIELAQNGDATQVKQWINTNVERICTDKNLDWYNKTIGTTGQDAGYYLNKTERVAIAHAEYTDTQANAAPTTHNPDDPDDYWRTQNDLTVIRVLAKEILSTITRTIKRYSLCKGKGT